MTSTAPKQQNTWRKHQPVLADAVLRLLDPQPGKIIFDGTLGGGGHAKLLLEKGVFLFGCDRDPEAIACAKNILAPFADNLQIRHQCYDETFFNPESLDGILIDLGVSSHQLETPQRGFSFLHDGPLDMRMDTTTGRTAADILADATDNELYKILITTEDSPAMRALARALLAERRHTRFETTRQLAAWVEKMSGSRWRRTHHPATLLFQSLRIAVNGELQRLENFLNSSPGYLKPGGVLVIITFHSGEDRLVKKYFDKLSRLWLDTPAWPNSKHNPHRVAELVTKKPIIPDAEEISKNPRARSARLRAIRKLSVSIEQSP